MSGVFSKSILKVGTYHSPDGTVVVTPERLKHWERETKRLQSVGYAIPSHFDHANDIDLLEPIAMDVLARKQNRSAKATVGKLDSFRVSADGQSAEIVLHTLTSDATESVGKNAVYVSPVIFPEWKDGAGNHFRDVLTSFDLVDHPVDYSQTSFVPAIKMSQAVCPAIRMGQSKPYFLGARMPKSRSQQARKLRFRQALVTGLRRMGSDYDPEDADDDEPKTKSNAGVGDGGTGDDDSSAPAPKSDETPDPGDDPSPTESLDVAGNDAPDLLDSVLNLLNEFGVALPEDTTDRNLIPHLRVALTALLNAEAKADAEDDDGVQDMSDPSLPGEAPGGAPVASAPNIAVMSLQQRKALERAEVLEKRLHDQHRDATRNALAGLLKTGRCTPAEHDQFCRTLNTVRMSLNDVGDFKPTRVDAFIQDRSAVPEGTFWTDKQRSAPAQKLSVVEAPTEWNGGGGNSAKDINEAIVALGGRV